MTRITLLPLLLCVACDPTAKTPTADSACGETDGLACFADASDDERKAAADAGLGLATTVSWLEAAVALNDATFSVGEACPSLEIDGDTAVLRAEGCAGEISGAIWTGELRWQNPPPMVLNSSDGEVIEVGAGYDETAASELRFLDWRAVTVDDGVETLRVADGSLWSGPLTDDAVESRVDLDFTAGDRPTVHVSLHERCGESGCEALSPTTGEVDGLGSFTVREVSEGGALVAIALDGADTMEITASEDGDCLSVGEAVDYCQDEMFPSFDEGGEIVDDEDLAFYGTGIGSESGSQGEFFDLHATVVGAAGAVDVWVVDSADPDLGTEGYALEDADADGYWQLKVGTGDRCRADDCSAFPFEDADLLVVAYRLYDADRTLVSCAFNSRDVEDPASWFDTSDCPRID